MKTLAKLSLVIVAVIAFTLLSSAVVTQAAGPGGSMGMGGPQNSLVSIAAKTLGMTQVELLSALQGGKTIADVAKDKNVALDTIVTAFVTARQEVLSAAVTSGHLTQAQADTMIGVMKANVLTQLSKPFAANGPWFGDNDATGRGMMNGQGMRNGVQPGARWQR